MNSGSDIVLVVHDPRSDRAEVIDFMPGEVYSPRFRPASSGYVTFLLLWHSFYASIG
jgi:hypothetical protein